MSAYTVVGHGPKFHTTNLSRTWRGRLSALGIGSSVDVLLDNGDIARTQIRALSKDAAGRVNGNRCCVWVEGIVGSYAAGRVRPADGWWRTRGCVRAVTP